jgi:hypothetical protein
MMGSKQDRLENSGRHQEKRNILHTLKAIDVSQKCHGHHHRESAKEDACYHRELDCTCALEFAR